MRLTDPIPKRGNTMRTLKITLTLAGAAALAACTLNVPAESGTADPAAAASAVAGALTEGTYTVPREMAPGRYAASVPADSLNCYWARLKDTNGTLESIAANGNVKPGGRITVTIKASDRAFETTGCGTWKRVKTP
jgi:hypothetical protein